MTPCKKNTHIILKYWSVQLWLVSQPKSLSKTSSWKMTGDTHPFTALGFQLFYIPQLLFVSIFLPLSASSPLCCFSLTDDILPSFTPVDSLTNHVAWQCLLSNATNQADSKGPEVNWHSHSHDGLDACRPIRLYWFKWIAPHLRGIYQCVNGPPANHKSPLPARPWRFAGNPVDWRGSTASILSK